MASFSSKDTPITVFCASGHFFCFRCLDEAHSPVTCKEWFQWKHELQIGQEKDKSLQVYYYDC